MRRAYRQHQLAASHWCNLLKLCYRTQALDSPPSLTRSLPSGTATQLTHCKAFHLTRKTLSEETREQQRATKILFNGISYWKLQRCVSVTGYLQSLLQLYYLHSNSGWSLLVDSSFWATFLLFKPTNSSCHFSTVLMVVFQEQFLPRHLYSCHALSILPVLLVLVLLSVKTVPISDFKRTQHLLHHCLAKPIPMLQFSSSHQQSRHGQDTHISQATQQVTHGILILTLLISIQTSRTTGRSKNFQWQKLSFAKQSHLKKPDYTIQRHSPTILVYSWWTDESKRSMFHISEFDLQAHVTTSSRCWQF